MRLRTPLIVAFLGLALSPGSALAAPPNDAYANARALDIFERDDPALRTNAGATTAGGEPQPCDGVTVTATIWYRIPGTGGPVTLNTVGSAPDTVLAVYDTDGSTAPTTLNEIGCNNDIWDGGDETDDRASELVFDTDAGSDYLVQIGSCPSCGSSPALPATGRIEFIAYDAPAHDARAAAQALPAGHGVLTDNFGATTETNERLECGAEHQYGKTVWFRFNAPQSGNAVFTTGGAFDAVMAVYRGATRLGCNDDGVAGAVGPSRLALHLDPGEYLVQVGGWGGDIRSAYGDFSVQADFTADPPPVPPDRDGDGISDASDRCPDESSRARDANADGCLDAVPPPPLKSLRSSVSSVWNWSHRRYTRVVALRVNAVPAGATVKVTCKSKPRRRCPRSKTYRIKKNTKKLNLRKPFKGRKLPRGTTVTIQVTAPGYEGKVSRYRTRKGKRPSVSLLCLQPGAKKPGSCL
jgi:hypothetical protein